MKNDPIESALARLDELPAHTAEGKAGFTKALAAKSNLVVAKAARIIASTQWTELTGELANAFERVMARGASSDKGCAASIAISRALVQMDYDSPELFRRGMKHVQMEASWGPAVDTAVELRSVCAMGLANSTYPHKLPELVQLLVDREWQARVGAIRAIATVGGEAGSLLLRYKMLSGDKDPEVMAECFTAMLTLEGRDGVALVAEFVEAGEPEVRDAAILAMGASRRPDAVEWLTGLFGRTAAPGMRKCILLSLATSRVEAAMDFLLELIREGSETTANLAESALAIHGRDEQLRGRVEAARAARGRTAI